MTASARNTAVIAGGGVAGIACALALERVGWQPVVVERSPDRTGTGLFVPANGARSLAAFGVLSELVARGTVVPSQRMFDASGQLLAEHDLEQSWGPDHPCIGVRRADLLAALTGALGATTTIVGAVTGVVERGESVEVRLGDGGSLGADLFIAADGVESAVRGATVGVTATYSGESYWRAIVDCPPSVTTWSGFWEGPRMLGLLPIGAGEAYLFVGEYGLGAIGGAVPPPPERPTGADFPVLRRCRPEVAGTLDDATGLHYTPARTVLVDPMVGDRILLVGDAAHGCSPSLAQGVSAALEDALVLAETIDRNAVGCSLRAFASRRRDAIHYLHRTTRARTQVARLPEDQRRRRLQAFGKASVAMLSPMRAR